MSRGEGLKSSRRRPRPWPTVGFPRPGRVRIRPSSKTPNGPLRRVSGAAGGRGVGGADTPPIELPPTAPIPLPLRLNPNLLPPLVRFERWVQILPIVLTLR